MFCSLILTLCLFVLSGQLEDQPLNVLVIHAIFARTKLGKSRRVLCYEAGLRTSGVVRLFNYSGILMNI